MFCCCRCRRRCCGRRLRGHLLLPRRLDAVQLEQSSVWCSVYIATDAALCLLAPGLYIVFCFQKQSNDELQVVKMPEQSEGSEEQGPGLGQEIKEQGQEQDQEQDQERFQEGEEQRQGEECGEED